MRKVTVTQSDVGTWAGDAVIRTGLEEDGLITRINVTVEITPSATLRAAVQPDGLFRIVQNLRIVGGGHTYWNGPADDGCLGGVLQHYLNMIDGFGPGHSAAAITAPQLTFTPVNFVFHMGSRPRNQWGRDNPYDLTAFIPAHAESQLNAEWQTSGNDILDDTVTVSSAVAAYTISRVVGSPDEIRAEMARQQVRLPFDPVPGGNPIVGMVPVHSAVNHGNAGTTTDFTAETVNIPMGAFLKRIAFVTQDATVVRTLRTQDGVTRLAITSPSTTEDIFRARLQHQLSLLPYGSNLVANAGAANSVDAELSTDFDAHAPFGIHAIDMRQFAQNIPGEDYGIDLRGFKTGDLVVGLYITTFASGDDTLFLFERYQPYRGALN